MSEPLRTLFFGTSEFAVPSLRVVARETQLAGVVTQPDRASGRGHKLTASPVKTAALSLGLTVYQPERLKAFAQDLSGDPFDLFILASYGRILPQVLLELPRLGALNVHPSLLPKYRGATPIQTALARGEERTGVSIMLMDCGMDTGDIVLQEQTDIGDNENYGTLADRLALEGASLLQRVITLAGCGPLESMPQRGEATVTKPIRKEDLAIDWDWTPVQIVNHVRAYAPQPAARGLLDGETVKLLRAHVAADGRLAIDELIAPNRGRMSGEEYRRSRAVVKP